MDNTLQFVQERYETGDNDAARLGPRTRSAEDAPPVGRVYAVYGINLPTEVGGVYRRRSVLAEGGHRVEKLHELDDAARLKSNGDDNAQGGGEGLSVKDGVILENPYRSKREEDFGQVIKSGDGTVPYWSMRHCKRWQGPKCQVEVVEIDKADHREILADVRFHKVVINYVMRKKEVEAHNFLKFASL